MLLRSFFVQLIVYHSFCGLCARHSQTVEQPAHSGRIEQQCQCDDGSSVEKHLLAYLVRNARADRHDKCKSQSQGAAQSSPPQENALAYSQSVAATFHKRIEQEDYRQTDNIDADIDTDASQQSRPAYIHTHGNHHSDEDEDERV